MSTILTIEISKLFSVTPKSVSFLKSINVGASPVPSHVQKFPLSSEVSVNVIGENIFFPRTVMV